MSWIALSTATSCMIATMPTSERYATPYGGNLQAFQNTGGVEIRRNVIDGNLQCKTNNPAPIGGNNVVGGNKEDQCKRL